MCLCVCVCVCVCLCVCVCVVPKALYATGNAVADEALSWVIEHVDDPDLNDEPNVRHFHTRTEVDHLENRYFTMITHIMSLPKLRCGGGGGGGHLRFKLSACTVSTVFVDPLHGGQKETRVPGLVMLAVQHTA